MESATSRRPPAALIIDTDAGIDDAQALLVAFAECVGKSSPSSSSSPSSRPVLLGLTCVAGNVPLDLVVGNVGACLDAAGWTAGSVPLLVGASRPLISPHKDASAWHGSDGLGNTGRGLLHALPPPEVQQPREHAAVAIPRLCREWIASQARGDDETGQGRRLPTLIALGPLTNLALAVRLDPALPSLVESVVIMGGACQAVGNASLASEFNIQADAEAARIVLGAFPRITLVTWELTMRCGLDDAFMDRWAGSKAPPTRAGAFVADVTAHLIRASKAEGEEYAALGFLIPDPLAMCVALRPAEVVTRVSPRRRRVYVELAGSVTRGMTAVDWDGRGIGGSEDGADVTFPNVEIVEAVNMDVVRAMLLGSVGGGGEAGVGGGDG
jgi:purine nucleosidase